jgi:hypothetical protein
MSFLPPANSSATHLRLIDRERQLQQTPFMTGRFTEFEDPFHRQSSGLFILPAGRG